MEAAAVFLAVRPRSEAETRRRLRVLGYPPALVDDVVERLLSVGYLDDRAFARAWVESRDRSRPRGSLALRRELHQKGVSRDIVDEVLANRSKTPAAHAPRDVDPGMLADRRAGRQLLERHAARLQREADPRRRRQKAYALLARHGFTPDICAELAASLAGGLSLSDDEGV